jgi:hypothetical protein
LLWVLASFVAGCGLVGSDGEAARTITRADVFDLPPGDAVGSTFSGSYVVVAGAVQDCRCRQGRCDVSPGLGAIIVVVQQDGALTFGNSTGGVDEDGRFWVGLADEGPTGASFFLTTGQFRLAMGSPASFHALDEWTVVDTAAGADCDFRGSLQTRYLGP